MRKQIRQSAKAACLITILSCLPLAAEDPHITAAERTKLLTLLEDSRKEFLAAISGVGEAQWNWKASTDRWSIGECAEHIVLADASLFARAQTALASPADAAWQEKTKGKTEWIEYAIAPRLGKAQAPEPIAPRGGMTLAQAKESFERQRVDIVRFARDTGLPLKEHTADSPLPMFGTLNAYQWLIYAPLHTMRHDKQIAEVKATPGYPK